MTGETRAKKSATTQPSASGRPPARATARRAAPAPPPSALIPYRPLLIILAALAGVIVIAVVLFQSAAAEPYTCGAQLTAPPVQAVSESQPGFVTELLPTQHVPAGITIHYGFCPPTSGDHYSSPNRGPIRPGIYGPATEQAPGGWVHNLEHGSVALLYRCSAGVVGQGDCPSADEMDRLSEWFNDAPTDATCNRQALVARFDTMSKRFAVVAWNRALLLDEMTNTGLGLADAFAVAWTDVTAPESSQC